MVGFKVFVDDQKPQIPWETLEAIVREYHF